MLDRITPLPDKTIRALREGREIPNAVRVRTALVVDGDAVSRRFVELALGREDGFVVEAVNDAASALEVLGTQLVDVIVSETMLTDMNGLRFFRRLTQESRLRSIPFVFLSADKRADTKVLALRAGVDDFITKPCDVAEFAARVDALVERQRRTREEANKRSYTLAGDFSAIGFPDLVSIIEMGRRSGVLSIATAHLVGQVFFDTGRVIHAVYGNLSGVDAFYRFVGESDGQFEFSPCASCSNEIPETIQQSVTALIMEGARLFDTERDKHCMPMSATRIAQRPRMPSTIPPESIVAPGIVPDTTLAAQFELAVRDPFALGEMSLMDREQLGAWSRSASARDRFHVHLVADLSEGVSAILPVSGAPTEKWILSSLAPAAKALALTFFLRHERSLDVALVDARDPMTFQKALLRVPSVMIIAPPGGDVMAIGTKARVALEALVQQLQPPAVVGVGTASLETGLRAMGISAASGLTVRCTEGVLGQGACDLRALLIKGIRLWASTGGRPTLRP
jgi:CheY-like chemotaxis protein